MLIVIDIGNTNITMGLVDNNEIIDNYRLTTNPIVILVIPISITINTILPP